MKYVDIAIVFLIFIIIYYINNIYTQRKQIQFRGTSKIRPSYQNEFWNFNHIRGKVRSIINDKYGVYEYNTNDIREENIKNTHSSCPVMEGNKTKITSCIQYPNRIPEGGNKSITSGFLVSTCCKTCINEIQKSFNNNDKKYDIIYRNNEYFLTKDGEKKQLLLGCNPINFDKFKRLVNTKNL